MKLPTPNLKSQLPASSQQVRVFSDPTPLQELIWNFHFLIPDKFGHILTEEVVRGIGVDTTIQVIVQEKVDSPNMLEFPSIDFVASVFVPQQFFDL